MIDRFLLLVRSLRRNEQGMALPVALFAMISSMALAGAAVVATTDVQLGASRDQASKSAIAAADAGAAVARARQNRYGFILNNFYPCLAIGTDGNLTKAKADGTSGWCPPVSGTIGDAGYVYQVSPVGKDCGAYELCVVSTGTAGERSRRIEVTFDRSGLATNETELVGREVREKQIIIEEEIKEALEKEEFEKVKIKREELQKLLEEEWKRIAAEGFIGRDGITLSGNAEIHVGLGTNGNLTSSGNATVCDDIRIGIGKKWSKTGNAKQCAGYTVTQGNAALEPVSSFMPTNIAAVNSNNRLLACTSTNVPVNCQKDSYTGNWKSKPPFDSKTRAITLSSNDTLTVGGGDYWICSITMSGNSELIMAQGARVRFFFDTPQKCGTGNQLSLSGNNRISATGYQPSLGRYEMPGFYFLGSTTMASQISLSGNYSTTNEMIVYGPDTYINVSGNATFKGILVGKEINMSGNGKVMQDAGFQTPPELNPGSLETEIREIEELEEKWVKEGRTPEEIAKKREDERIKREEEEVEKTNRSPIYYTPQAYFECIGLPTAGEAPNANC